MCSILQRHDREEAGRKVRIRLMALNASATVAPMDQMCFYRLRRLDLPKSLSQPPPIHRTTVEEFFGCHHSVALEHHSVFHHPPYILQRIDIL